MDVKQVLDALHSNDAINSLADFSKQLHDCDNAKEQLITFLKSSPNFDSILRLLNREKQAKSDLATVFETLNFILLSLSDDASYESEIHHISRWVLQNHAKLLASCLTPASTARAQIAALQFLTRVVASGRLFAHELLTHLNLDAVNFERLANRKDQSKSKDVRTCLFLFILAFLKVNSNKSLTRFLETPSCVTSIFKGLPEDPFELVNKLLNLLLNSVVLNRSISKTIKAKIFTSDNFFSLYNLYFHSEETKTNFTDIEKRKLKISLHKLVIPLCSSYKDGLVFASASKCESLNPLAFSIFKKLKSPWDFEEGRELICNILISCPLFYKQFASLTKPFSTPRESEGYLSLFQLYIMIIERESAVRIFERVTQKEFKESILTVFPFVTSNSLKTILFNSSFVLQFYGLLLITCLLNKVLEIIEIGYDEGRPTDNLQSNKLKNALLRGLEDFTGGSASVINLWDSIYEKKNIIEIPNSFVPDLTRVTLLTKNSELLYVYTKIYSYDYLILKGRIDVLGMLEKSLNICNERDMRDDPNYQELLLYILKLLLSSRESRTFETVGICKTSLENDDKISIDQGFFGSLVKLYCYYSPKCSLDNANQEMIVELQKTAMLLMNSTLDYWGLSAYCENHLELWLNKIVHNKIEMCSDFLTKLVSISVNRLSYYLNCMLEGSGYQNSSKNSFNVIEAINELDSSEEVIDNDDVKFEEMKLSFPILVLGAVDILRSNPDESLIKYFSCVMEDYFYFASNPDPLSVFLLKHEQLLDLGMRVYLKSWLGTEKDASISLPKNGPSSSIKKIFLEGNVPSASNFCCELQNEIKIQTELSTICRQLYFYAEVEFKKHTCKKKRLKFFFKVLKNLLKRYHGNVNNLQVPDILEYLMKHPFTLNNFTPYDSAKIVPNEINDLICLVIKDHPSLHHLIKPYLNKAVDILNSTNEDKLMLNSSLIDLLDIRCITYSDVENLIQPITNCITCPMSEVHIITMNKLLDILITHSSINHQPSRDVCSLFAKKLVYMLQQVEITVEEIVVVQKLIKAFSFAPKAVFRKLDEDEVRILVSRKEYNTDLQYLISDIHHPFADHIIEKIIKKKEFSLRDHSSLIACLLKTNRSKKNLETSISENKHTLVDLFLNSEDEWNEDLSYIFNYLLQNERFSISEMNDACNQLYQKIVTEKTIIPLRLTTLVPIFDYVFKISNNSERNEVLHPYVQLLLILMQLVTKMYKTLDHSEELLAGLQQITHLVSNLGHKLISEHLYQNKLWLNFVKQALKGGLTDAKYGPSMLECLISLIRIVYYKRRKDEEGIISIEKLYQMLRSHSSFVSLMIGAEEDQERIKEVIVRLQLTLVECCPGICEEKHVPLLLGAYGASNSKSDQTILGILYIYEESGAMPNIEPLVWSNVAISHFAVEKGPGVNIEYKTPTHLQSLQLLNYEKVIETALNFDMELELKPGKISSSNSELYDQRYLLSLFMLLSRDEPQADIFKYLEKGMLAMAVAALSSHRDEVWAVGAAIMKNVVENFQNSRHINLKHQWMWFIGVLGYGLENKRTRISSMIVHFLVRATAMMLSPDDTMYQTVMNYLFLMPSFNLNQVPEFYNLIYSEDISHQEHRRFVLEILSAGIKEEVDVQMCKVHYVPKIIISLVSSNTVDTSLRVLGLKALSAMGKVLEGAQLLVLEYSVLTELPLALNPNMFCKSSDLSQWIDGVVDVLFAVWNSWLKVFIRELNFPEEEKVDPSNSRTPKRKNGDFGSESTEINKRRKISNGKFVNGVNKLRSTKEIKKIQKCKAGILELTACLGFIFPKVSSRGSVGALSRCVQLLSEVVTFEETSRKMCASAKLTALFSNLFLKKQIKSWIETSDLSKRLQNMLTEEESISLGFKQLAVDWKTKPLLAKDAEVPRDKDVLQLLSNTKSILKLVERHGFSAR